MLTHVRTLEPTVIAELVCLAAARVLLRHDDERHWLRAAPKLIGHLFPGSWAGLSTTSGCRTSRR